MLEKLSARLFAACQNNMSLFRMRVFFLVLLWGVISGLAVSALFFVSMGLSFQEDLILFVAPPGLFLVFSFIFFFVYTRLLYRRKSGEVLEALELPGRLKSQLALSLGRMDFREFEDILIREYDEERISLEEEQKRRLEAGVRFGIYVPDVQLEKILEDERFFALLGMERDALALGISLEGLSTVLSGLDGEERTGLLKKIYTEYRTFARQQDLLFHAFHSSGSFFYHGLPYDTESLPLSGLIKKIEKLLGKLSKLFSDMDVRPVCLVAHGTLRAGLAETDTGSVYLVDGGPVEVIHSGFRKLSGESGVFIHSSADEAEAEGWRKAQGE